MERNEFLKLYSDLPLNKKHVPLFLYRKKGIAWHDIYFEQWQNKGDRLFKAAEKKGFLKQLSKQK